MDLLVFLHGTVLMHAAAAGCGRAERVAQVRAREASVRDYGGYVPVGSAVARLERWRAAGARIGYLSSQRAPAVLALDLAVLQRYGFPAGAVHSRWPGESYGDVVVRVLPDVLIEDDCESIGAAEISYAQIPAGVRAGIRSVVVREFEGIDHLPENPAALG